MKIKNLREDGQLSNVKTIQQSDLTAECWLVQFHGIEYCLRCEYKDTDKCGGKEILKTGKNEKGKPVPLSVWTLTDPSFNQYGRKISDELYEFMEDVKYPDGTVQHIRETVNLNDYTEDQIIDVLCSYGYDYEEIKKSWKEKDVEWIIAECLFEMEV